MKLTSIELTNYRCYQKFEVDFRDGVNVIAGVNGSGKTSLLKGIREALAMAALRTGISIPSPAPLGEPDIAYIRAEQIGNRWRFEPQYPVEVAATGSLNGLPLRWAGASPAQGQSHFDGSTPIQQVAFNGEMQAIFPILAFYPAYRIWPAMGVSEVAAAIQLESRTAGYTTWWEASTDTNGLQIWGISKTLARLQAATENSSGWDSIVDDELAAVNEALSAVLSDAEGLRYDFSQKSLMIEWSNGKAPTQFRHLSDGQRVAIALVVDIARRMCLLNPHLGRSVVRETPGVVLIDELDTHLHPKWQRLMVRGLAAAFPKVQFICASHSPQILSEIKPENIILLTLDGAARPQVSYGLDSNRILEQIMDADPRPTEVEQGLSELFKCIEQNKLNDARYLLNDLKERIPGLPELTGAEALIKRKEVIGR